MILSSDHWPVQPGIGRHSSAMDLPVATRGRSNAAIGLSETLPAGRSARLPFASWPDPGTILVSSAIPWEMNEMGEHSTLTIVLLALITGAPAILLALARLIDALRTNRRLEDLNQAVNGRVEQLLQEREARARLEGFSAGRADRRREDHGGGNGGQDTSLPHG